MAAEFWTPIYFGEVKRMIANTLRPAQQGSGLLLFLELLNRVDRRSLNGSFGECRVGREELKTTIKSTDRTVRTILNRLKTAQIVTIKATKSGSIVTINDLDRYIYMKPQTDQQTDQQPPENRPESDQQTPANRPTNRPVTRSLEEEREREDKATTARAPADGDAYAPEQRPGPQARAAADDCIPPSPASQIEPEAQPAGMWRIRAIFEHWNSKAGPNSRMIFHEVFTDAMREASAAALGNYPTDKVTAAIDAYVTCLDGPEYRWNHAWTFDDFLRKGLGRFLPEARPLENFLRRTDEDEIREEKRRQAERMRERRTGPPGGIDGETSGAGGVDMAAGDRREPEHDPATIESVLEQLEGNRTALNFVGKSWQRTNPVGYRVVVKHGQELRWKLLCLAMWDIAQAAIGETETANEREQRE